MLLEGELGVGKTALWREGVARATVRVLSCQPVEAEAQLPYAALGDLLENVDLEGLPGPQRSALEVALLRAEPGPRPLNQRAVALGLLALLKAEPTVVAIDDVQWLDHPSEVVLAFAARRVGDARVGLLVSRRGGGPLPLHLPDAARTVVGPLGREDLAQLVGPLPRAELARVLRISGGNPFYALELAGCHEVPSTLRGLVGGRLDALSAEGRAAVELASALSRPAVDAALAPGVLERDGTRVRFVHPLLAELAYEQVADKRALHALAAELVDEPEERARHLALAAEAPDERVALALDDAARRARARGAPDAAAELLEQARRLTPGGSWRRGVEAAERWLEAGDAERARSLLEALLDEVPPGRDRAAALARLGWVRAHADGFRVAADAFRAALAERSDDVALRIEIEQGLAWCTHSFDSVAAAREHAGTALELAEAHGDPTLLAHTLAHVAFLDSLRGEGMATATIERALALPADPGWTQILGRPDWIQALLLLWDERLDEARERLRALRAEALERGDEHSLPFVLFQLARVELLLGDWDDAWRHAQECAESVEQSGQAGEGPYAAAIVALVAAHRGEAGPTEDGLALAERLGVQPAALELLAARGFLELSRGEVAAACATFDELAARVDASGLREPALFRWQADAIEANVLAGRGEIAAELFAALDRGRPWVREVVGRCELLVLGGGAAPREAARVSRLPFERARTLLVRGARERRSRQWRAAREALGEALTSFEALGAPLWAEKARGELARVGGRAPAHGDLTPTERRIAELIAAGRTYQQAADELFISPKTVQWNLSKVYRKRASARAPSSPAH